MLAPLIGDGQTNISEYRLFSGERWAGYRVKIRKMMPIT